MRFIKATLAAAVLISGLAHGQTPEDGKAGPRELEPPPVTRDPGSWRAMGGARITQDDITGGTMTLDEIRFAGMEVFSTPFTKADGFGDGPMNPADPTSPGGRPTMAGNGTFLRVNGLDSQSCLECHSVLSNRQIPATFAVGGVGGLSAMAMPGPTEIDIDDEQGNGFAFCNGRLINPPFIWGSGGVELVAKEMTIDLQALKAAAQATPDTPVPLVTHGVSFGTITYDSGTATFDTSGVEGIEPDLVVRPFGRKGNNASIRQFDLGALQFHIGMQPVEIVGEGVDADDDGVVDEILAGEISAMHVFSVLSATPRRRGGNWPQVRAGFLAFRSIGCDDCHVPLIQTRSTMLPIAFPEVETDPTANVFLEVELLGGSADFSANRDGGIKVPMYSDLKRHHMGDSLSGQTGDPLDPYFITPRLWGIADTAPYLHDGRALTLRDAIGLHDGEGLVAASDFAALPEATKIDLLAFLDTLRTPIDPNGDL